MRSRSVRVFVYGSLKRGFSNAAHLRVARARFEGAVATAPGFALYDLGAYPALVRVGRRRVEGEVYSVSPGGLSALDAFEGCPDLYQREEIELEDGTWAMAYLMSAAAVRGRSCVDNGVWLEKLGDGHGTRQD